MTTFSPQILTTLVVLLATLAAASIPTGRA